MNVSDLSIDRLGEFAIDDFATKVADVGSVKLGHFAIGNVALPGADGLVQAMRAGQGSGNPDMAALAPKPGFIAMSGLETADRRYAARSSWASCASTLPIMSARCRRRFRRR